MSTYRISELIESLSTAQEDGYEYVDISILPPEDDMEESINLDFIEDSNSCENDMIDSISLPSDYICHR